MPSRLSKIRSTRLILDRPQLGSDGLNNLARLTFHHLRLCGRRGDVSFELAVHLDCNFTEGRAVVETPRDRVDDLVVDGATGRLRIRLKQGWVNPNLEGVAPRLVAFCPSTAVAVVHGEVGNCPDFVAEAFNVFHGGVKDVSQFVECTQCALLISTIR